MIKVTESGWVTAKIWTQIKANFIFCLYSTLFSLLLVFWFFTSMSSSNWSTDQANACSNDEAIGPIVFVFSFCHRNYPQRQWAMSQEQFQYITMTLISGSYSTLLSLPFFIALILENSAIHTALATPSMDVKAVNKIVSVMSDIIPSLVFFMRVFFIYSLFSVYPKC